MNEVEACVQNNQMTFGDTLGLGFMTFAFFLGAGNLIFPPFAGLLAGENMMPAMVGFLFTAVGMPLIGLIAVAKSNGKVMGLLPPFAAIMLAVAIYLIIGPAFAAPRTSLVAFEIGARPFISHPDTMISIGGLSLNLAQLIYTLCFFCITLLLSIFPGKLLDSVGKILTPILIFLLVGLAISVLVFPGADIGEPVGEYASSPLVKGVIEGYNTMDTLASVIFGMLIIDILRKKGITDSVSQTRYLVHAAIIAAAGLAFVYISLFYLGAVAGDVAKGAENGGQILTHYVTSEFGFIGVVLLGSVVTLACLTTAIGLVTACAEYFNEIVPKVSYRVWAIITTIICALVANIGLTQLIQISIPVLVTIYPVVIALVAMTFLTEKLANPALSQKIVLSVAMLFGIMDGLKVAGIDMSVMDFMPLYKEGMAWLLPTSIAIVACLFLKQKVDSTQVA